MEIALLWFGVRLGCHGPGCTVDVVSIVGIHCGQAVNLGAFRFGFGARVLPDSEVRFPLWPRAIRTGGYVGAGEVVSIQFTQQEAILQAVGDITLIAGGAGRLFAIRRLSLAPLTVAKGTS